MTDKSIGEVLSDVFKGACPGDALEAASKVHFNSDVDSDGSAWTNFGSVVASWRLFQGWTLQELADKAGTSKGYLHDIESGRRNPSAKMRKRLLEALGL